MADTTVTTKRIFLMTSPRTASHLLEKILSKQPGAQIVFHPFVSARNASDDKGGREMYEKLVHGTFSPAYQEETKRKYNNCMKTALETIAKVEEEGKIPLMHEHPMFVLDPAVVNDFYLRVAGQNTPDFASPFSPEWTLLYPGESTPRPRTNPLMFPDEFLLANDTRVIMPIRHPALSYPSIYRTVRMLYGPPFGDPGYEFYMSLTWHRIFFDWMQLNAPANKKPIIIDADDVMDENGPAMRKLCTLVGFDPKALLYQWGKATPEELAFIPPDGVKVMNTLLTSEGLRKDKTANALDMDVEAKKWKEEFGEEQGEWIRRCVERNMVDYEYLRQFRLTADGVNGANGA